MPKGRYIFNWGGGVGRGILEIFAKKAVPSHFPEWINAWPFTNTYTKTSDPPPWKEGSEREIGENTVNVVNCLLDCISKAETDMKHVTGEQLQRVLNPVLNQCDEVLRRIACLRLPPGYPRLLELTDAGPVVGVSSAESRIRILEKARMHGNEKVLRIH